MTLAELIAEFRMRADDTARPYLWSDDSVVRWLNDAEQQACRRSLLLIDSSTAEIVTLTVAAGALFIDVDPRVVRVIRAKQSGQPKLTITTQAEMDRNSPNWDTTTSPVPAALLTDVETGKLRVYPIPTADVVINLQVQRLPLESLSIDTQDAEPEIAPAYHLALVDWALYRAYSVQDVDTYDEEKSKKHSREFAREFGQAPSARSETIMNLHGGHDWIAEVFV